MSKRIKTESELAGEAALEYSEEILVGDVAWFACNAPTEIPDWFKHEPPELTELPSAPELSVPAHLKEVCDHWRLQPEYDLASYGKTPEDEKFLASYSDAMTAFWMEASDISEANTAKDQEARFFQWRWYYGRKMKAMRDITLAQITKEIFPDNCPGKGRIENEDSDQ